MKIRKVLINEKSNRDNRTNCGYIVLRIKDLFPKDKLLLLEILLLYLTTMVIIH